MVCTFCRLVLTSLLMFMAFFSSSTLQIFIYSLSTWDDRGFHHRSVRGIRSCIFQYRREFHWLNLFKRLTFDANSFQNKDNLLWLTDFKRAMVDAYGEIKDRRSKSRPIVISKLFWVPSLELQYRHLYAILSFLCGILPQRH